MAYVTYTLEITKFSKITDITQIHLSNTVTFTTKTGDSTYYKAFPSLFIGKNPKTSQLQINVAILSRLQSSVLNCCYLANAAK